MQFPPLAVVIPASGVGKRMATNIPKQYLTIQDKTILERTIERFTQLPFVSQVLVAIAEHDTVFDSLPIANHPKITTVTGGKERANSVYNGLLAVSQEIDWVMVHDAARPCVQIQDIENLYGACVASNGSGILASRVRDTMKRSDNTLNIDTTVDRNNLWHAHTPQCANRITLTDAIAAQLDEHGDISALVTDEASALELAGVSVQLIESSVKNIKITQPEDLELAEFYIQGEA